MATPLGPLRTSYLRTIRAQGKAPGTIRLYGRHIAHLADWAGDDLDRLTRAGLTDYFLERQDGVKASTVSVGFRAIRTFMAWLTEEGHLSANPMDRMKGPRVKVQPVPVYADDDVRALLRACEGRTFREKRDMALLRLLWDTGIRRGELSGIRLADVDLDAQTVVVTGKTGTRVVPFGSKTADALDRYMLARYRHAHAGLSWLWLGPKGLLTRYG